MRRVRIAPTAAREIVALLATTETHFGMAAVERYRLLIQTALEDVRSDPARPGVRAAEGGPFLTYHLRHSRTRVFGEPVGRPRHLLIFTANETLLNLTRVLHDAMDLPARLTDDA